MRHVYLVLGIIIGACCVLMWTRGKPKAEPPPKDTDWDKRIESLNNFYEEEKRSQRLRR